MAGAEEVNLRKYLIGQLTEAEEEQIEIRLLSDSDFAEEFDIVVDEITDDYVAGKFAGDEREQVERYFFKAPGRRHKLKFALALKARKSETGADKGKKHRFMPYLAIAASVLLAAGGFYIWRTKSNNSELNKGLVALQSAYRETRPLEARLSDFPYAPFANERGGSTRIDYLQRDRAASLLLNAVAKHPNAASQSALGKYYLAEHQFDKAIEQFQAALKLDPKNARIYNDLGAAYLEKAKSEREVTDPDKEIETLDRSLENLNKALSLNPNFNEVVFNRALCHEYLGHTNEAGQDWRRYLQLDPASPWATEANQLLRSLEQRNLPRLK